MRIQHNIMAMSAYRNYTNNVAAMKKNLEKLSSGYKINRAGDDAAGLAISEKMRAQITGLETAQKNAKDGISLVQTAEGALTEVHDMLNRMVELATMSANGTYDDTTDRAQLQKEMDQLRSEINRIADSSNFNGINLLDGSMESNALDEFDLGAKEITGAFAVISDGQLGNKQQAGVFELDLENFTGKVDDGQTSVTLSIFGKDLTIDKLSDGKNDVALKAGDTIGGDDGDYDIDALADAIAAKFNAANDFTADYGVYLYAENTGSGKITFTMMDADDGTGDATAPTAKWDVSSAVEFGNLNEDYGTADSAVGNQAQGIQVRTLTEPVDSSAERKYAQASVNLNMLDIKDGTTLTIGDTTYTFAVGKKSANKEAKNVIDLTDLTDDTVKANIGLVASRITTAAQGNKNFKVTAVSALGDNKDGMIYLTEKEGGVDTKDYKLEGKTNTSTPTDGDWTGLVKFGKIGATANKGLTLQIGDTADDFNQLKVSIKDCHTEAIGIDEISIADQDSAQKAVDAIKSAINYISDVRGTLGATQNRLDHTINNLSVMTENIQDAESTIRDTDVADEMMAYTKNNILIQSAQAMLAQANQVPQGVLQLLQ